MRVVGAFRQTKLEGLLATNSLAAILAIEVSEWIWGAKLLDINNPPYRLLTTALFTGMISLVLFDANIIWRFFDELIVQNKRKNK